jgi:hypothetical protein
MTTPDDNQLSYDEVLDRVLVADPESFYGKAQAFDDAVTALHDVRNVLLKRRRAIDEMWSTTDLNKLAKLDELTRHLELLIRGMRDPGYSRVLRRIGDVLRDSQQRLLSMRDDHGADPAARADRDKRARKILADLSTSYGQLGSLLQELPKRTANGGIVPASFAHAPGSGVATGEGSAATHASSCSTGTVGKAHAGIGVFDTAPKHAELVDATAQPDVPAQFAGFAHYASQPAAPGRGRATPSFSGFAAMADPDSQAAAVVLSQLGTGASRPTVKALVDKALPGKENPLQSTTLPSSVKVEVTPDAATPVVSSVPATTAGPAAAPAVPSAPAQVSLTGSTAATAAPPPAPATPGVPLKPPPPPGPPAEAVATNASAPLAMSATPTVAYGSSTPGSMMRPGMTSAPVLAPAAPVRGSEVWLRADTSAWQTGPQSPARLDREGIAGPEIAGHDSGCAAGLGKGTQ